MVPENFYFGGGSTETILHPIVVVAMLAAIVLIFLLPRKYILVPFLLIMLLCPQGQQWVVGGVHLFVGRVVVLFAWIRLLQSRFTSKTRLFAGGWTPIDTAFLWWAVFYAITFILYYRQVPAMVNRMGFLWSTLGGYFLLRYMIQDDGDIRRAIKVLAIIAVIVAVAMVNEQLTGHNVFGFLGGIRSAPEIREGRIRSQGVFQHPLLAGAFGATLVPLFVLLFKDAKSKFTAITGVLSSTVITLAAASSTPVLAYVGGVFGLALWPLRRHMRAIRWGIVLSLVALHFVMKAPVWFLISHIDVTGASSGWHRAMLVDDFVRHFRDWWLLGTDTSSWGYDMWDLSNEYVNQGESGGLATFICFLAIIWRGFGALGTARRTNQGDPKREWFVWCLGAAWFAHVVGFFGINYWDQMQCAWFALLAMICAATAARAVIVAEPVRQSGVIEASALPSN